MSFVNAVPQALASAAADVAAVGSAVSAAHLAAAAPTVGVLPAAADEVSGAVSQLFSRVAQEYQSVAGQAAAFGQQFAQHLTAAAGSYAATEAAGVASLQHATASAASIASIAATSPVQLLQPLIDFLNTLTAFTEYILSIFLYLALAPPLLAYLSVGLGSLGVGAAILAAQTLYLLVISNLLSL